MCSNFILDIPQLLQPIHLVLEVQIIHRRRPAILQHLQIIADQMINKGIKLIFLFFMGQGLQLFKYV